MESLEIARGRQLFLTIPDSFMAENGTLLYVGAKPGRLQMVDLFRQHGFFIDAMEAWRPNVDALIEWNKEKKVFRRIFRGNIRQRAEIPDEKYDVVMFWHGPEHVTREDLPFVLLNMESIATRFVICASPWGRYQQGTIDGNPFEKHVSHLYETDFGGFGYQTATLGTKDKKGSNLLAWKVIR